MSDPDCDVLIVGAGPTGLTLALLLARRGVKVVVAEREREPYPLPRAAHIDHQVVRVFQELGLADEIIATCRHSARYDFLTASGEVLLRLDGSDRIGPGGWPAANMIHQPSIEHALRRAVAAEAGIALHPGWRLTALDGIATRPCGHFDTGNGARTISAHYIVGADGARSTMRDLLGIAVDDLGFDETWLVVDTIVQDASRLPSINLQICDPARPTTCVLMGEGRHRWEFMVKPGEATEALLTDDRIARLLDPWDVDGAVELERKAAYRFAARIAARWQQERALLAGDAAHQMPPFAGQGLCSGIRDAANLAWKLAAILRDDANPEILASYQPEREPNVRAIIGLAMMMGRTVCITDPQAAAARDARMLAARAACAMPDNAVPFPDITTGLIADGTPAAGDYFPQPVAQGIRLDDQLGPGPWLIRRGPGEDVPFPFRQLDIHSSTPCSADLTAWLDAHDAEAVLVRPDRYVFGTGKASELAERFVQALERR